MASRYLHDTNICIYIRRRRPPAVLTQFLQLKAGEAVLSVITYGELAYGMVKRTDPPPNATEQLQEFIGLINVMPLLVEAGRIYGEIRAVLESKGLIIGSNDLWIAAHAIGANL